MIITSNYLKVPPSKFLKGIDFEQKTLYFLVADLSALVLQAVLLGLISVDVFELLISPILVFVMVKPSLAKEMLA